MPNETVLRNGFKSNEDSIVEGILAAESLQLDPAAIAVDTEGLLAWNSDEHTVDLHTGFGTIIQLGQESVVHVWNISGATIPNGSVVRPVGTFTNGLPNIGTAIADSHETISAQFGVTTGDILNDAHGFVTIFGKVRGIDTLHLTPGACYISPTIAGGLTSIPPEFPNYKMLVGVVTVVNVDGTVLVNTSSCIGDTFNNFWNGLFREPFDFRIADDGGVITGYLSPQNGQPNLTLMFSDGFTTLVTTPPAEIILTTLLGLDTSPQVGYVYIPKSTKVLTTSTAGFPTEEHIKVADIALGSLSTTIADGALVNRNWNEELQSTTTNQGHLSHIGEKIRHSSCAGWDSGTEGTLIGLPTNGYVNVTGGTVYQMHKQTFPAQSMPTDNLYVVNHSTTPYLTVNDLTVLTTNALGDPFTNSSFSIVVWGVINKSGEQSHIMANLPTGGYSKNTPEDAAADAFNYSVYQIPRDFKGKGFLIARFTLTDTAGVWTLHATEDLRGKIPNSSAGGGAGGTGVTTFVALTDTPSTLVGNAGKAPVVGVGETALEFQSVLINPLTTVGDIIVADVTAAPARLGTTVPAANALNVIGITEGETSPNYKPLLDSTAPSTQAFGDAASPGISLKAAHVDHKHAMPAAATTTYTNATAVPVTIGGIAAGATFSNIELTAMWDSLLYPFQVPTFSTFSISGQATTLECGVLVTGGIRTFVWTTTNPTNIQTDSIAISDLTGASTLGSNLANDGAEDLDIGVSITKTVTAESHIWQISGTDTRPVSMGLRNFTVRWYSPFYYGVGAAALSVSQLQALTKSVAAKTNYTRTFSPTSQKFYYTYPASYGDLSSIIDPNGFNITDGFTKTVVDFTTNSPNYEGTTVSYNVYESDALTTQTSFNITFNF